MSGPGVSVLADPMPTPLLDRHAFVDLETTGLDAARDEVIELGIVYVERGQVVRRFTRLFSPSQPLPPVIHRITGLDDTMLAGHSPFSSFRAELVELLRGWTVVAHNAAFEAAFLAPELSASGAPIVDSCELLHYLHPELPSHALDAAVRWAQVGEGVSHRALQDAEDTFHVLAHALERTVREARVDELTELCTALDGPDAPAATLVLLHRALDAAKAVRPALELTESSASLPAPAHRLRVRPKRPPLAPGVLVHDAVALVGEGGGLEQSVPDFMARPPQVAMAKLVAQALDRGEVLAVEAGTGTGKSLGYLAPAVLLARHEGVRVGVAPHTRALQEQLVEKELGRLHEATQGAFGYAVLKGQQNYLCRRRALELTRPLPSAPFAERAARAYLRAFVKRSETGDVEKVSTWFRDRFPPLRELVWAARSESHATLERRCPHFSKCFFHSAVAQANQADVVVVNQALALQWPERYPPLTHLVFDEAHELEDTASSAWATSVSSLGLGGLVNRVLRAHGLAAQLARDGRPTEAEALVAAANDVVLDEKALAQAWRQVFEHAPPAKEQLELRISAPVRLTKAWVVARDAVHALVGSLDVLAQALGHAAKHDDGPWGRELFGGSEQARTAARALEELADRPSPTRCDSLVLEGPGVALGVAGAEPQAWAVSSQPVDVGPRFVSQVVEKARAVVLTSATLSTAPGSPFVLERLGLDRGARPATLVELDSPFDLARQALVVLVTDAPDPTTPAFVDWATQRIAGLARFLGGRTLGLFASSRRLQEVGTQLTKELSSDHLEVLKASRSGLRALAARQEEDLGSVLLGTKGLWQGLDVPGPGVSCVFIDKLPLEPSGRPLVEAREELLGGEPHGFMRYRLPRALLQLRQGVGRLVRSPHDKGVVVIADPGADTYRAQVYGALEGYRVEALPWSQARLRLHATLLAFGFQSLAAPRPTPTPSFTGQGLLFGS